MSAIKRGFITLGFLLGLAWAQGTGSTGQLPGLPVGAGQFPGLPAGFDPSSIVDTIRQMADQAAALAAQNAQSASMSNQSGALLQSLGLGEMPKDKRVETPITLKSGTDGLELITALRLVAQNAGYGFVHLKDLPNPKVRVSIEKRPFKEAWPALVYGTLGAKYDFLFTGNIVVVGEKEALKELLGAIRPTGVPIVIPPPPPAVIPVKSQEAELVVKTFFPEAKVIYSKDAQALVVQVPTVKHLGDLTNLLDAFGQVVKLEDKEAEYVQTTLTGESITSALKGVGVDSYPVAGGYILVGEKKALERARALLNELASSGVAKKEDKSPTEPPKPVLKIYQLPKNAQSALEVLKRVYGDGLVYSPDTGLLYALLIPDAHQKLQADLELIVRETGKIQTGGLPTVAGETMLNYTTKMPPTALTQALTPLFPEAQFVPVDSTSTLIVKAAPEVQIRVAEAIKRIDRPTEEALRKKAEEEKAASKEITTAVYKARYVPAESLAKLFKDLYEGGSSGGSGTSGGSARTQGGASQGSDEGSPGISAAANAQANMVTLKGPRSAVEEALKVLADLDQPPEQIRLRITIYQIKENAGQDLGISWTSGGSDTLGLSIAFGSGGAEVGLDLTKPLSPLTDLLKLQAQLNLLASKGLARKVLDTTALALNGSDVDFLSGGTLTVVTNTGTGGGSGSSSGGSGSTTSTQEYEFGLSVKTRPVILGDGSVMLTLETSLGDLPVSGPVPNSILLSKNKVTSTIRVPNGITAILGGVLGVDRTTNEQGIPILKEIPLLGNLFKTTTTGESTQTLLILVTPELVQNQPGKETKPEVTTNIPPANWQKKEMEKFNLGR